MGRSAQLESLRQQIEEAHNGTHIKRLEETIKAQALRIDLLIAKEIHLRRNAQDSNARIAELGQLVIEARAALKLRDDTIADLVARVQQLQQEIQQRDEVLERIKDRKLATR